MKPKSPCYQCEDRHDLCHSTCKKYLIFRNDLDRYNEKARRDSKTNADIDNHMANKLKSYRR